MIIRTINTPPLVTDDTPTFNTKAFATVGDLINTISDINAAIALNNITAAADVHATSSKGTLVDADEFPALDSAGAFALVKATWANIKATLIATAMTWTGVQKFTSSVLKILGSSTGSTALASANAGATDYTITLPAKTGTVVLSTDLGTGIATALAIAAGTAGAPALLGAAGNFTTLDATGTANFTTTGGYGVQIAENNIINGSYLFNGAGDLGINLHGYNGGTTQYRSLIIYDGKANVIAQFIGSATPKLAVTGALSATDTLTLSKNMTGTAGGAIAIENIIAPTLLNSWVNQGTGVNTAGYWKDAFGIVHLQGQIKLGSTSAAAFTLPVGYRPPNQVQFEVSIYLTYGSVFIDAAGNVTPVVSANNQVSLEGITFRTT